MSEDARFTTWPTETFCRAWMSKDRDLLKINTVHATRKCMPMRHMPK